MHGRHAFMNAIWNNIFWHRFIATMLFVFHKKMCTKWKKKNRLAPIFSLGSWSHKTEKCRLFVVNYVILQEHWETQKSYGRIYTDKENIQRMHFFVWKIWTFSTILLKAPQKIVTETHSFISIGRIFSVLLQLSSGLVPSANHKSLLHIVVLCNFRPLIAADRLLSSPCVTRFSVWIPPIFSRHTVYDALMLYCCS